MTPVLHPGPRARDFARGGRRRLPESPWGVHGSRVRSLTACGAGGAPAGLFGVRLPYVRSAMITRAMSRSSRSVTPRSWWRPTEHMSRVRRTSTSSPPTSRTAQAREVIPGRAEAALDALEEDPTRSLLERGLASRWKPRSFRGPVSTDIASGLRHSELCF